MHTLGLIGQQGLHGLTGLQGPRGFAGSRGQKGDRGQQGIRGQLADKAYGTYWQQGSEGRERSEWIERTSKSHSWWCGVGKTTCPSTSGTQRLYAGRAAGSYWTENGGGANHLCLPKQLQYSTYTAGTQSGRAYLYGDEYQNGDGYANSPLHCKKYLVKITTSAWLLQFQGSLNRWVV